MSFPQTPARIVPGAFLNTPAVASRFQASSDPVRRQLFPATDASSQNTTVSKSSAPTTRGSSAVATASKVTKDGLLVPSLIPAPRSENVPPVVKAAKAINTFLQADERFPELDSYCRRKLRETNDGTLLTTR